MTNPRGMASDPLNGHVYVADLVNSRIVEFSAWGVFEKAWGWGVANGEAKPQTCGPGATPPTATCLKGLRGGGIGQLAGPRGITVDPVGDIYVFERSIPSSDADAEGIESIRVQKFDSLGNSQLIFGGEVNKTKVQERKEEEANAEPVTITVAEENLCIPVSGDECGAGTLGIHDGQFANLDVGNYITADSAGTVYVGDRERIQMFNVGGVFIGEIKFSELHTLNSTFPEKGYSGSLALDPLDGDLYFAFSQAGPFEPHPDVFRLDPSTEEVLATLEVAHPSALATDTEGNVYVVETGSHILKFDPTGEVLIGSGENFDHPIDNTNLNGITTSTCGASVDLYVSHFLGGIGGKSYLNAYGPTPDASICPPPKIPPSIEEQYAVSVDADEALLKARINPHFWPDTTYYVEYGTAPCSGGGCNSQPTPPGNLLSEKPPVDAPVTSAGVLLSSLTPTTTYFYRFVSQSGGSEGQPVRGVGGEVGTDGLEATFTTPSLPEGLESCPDNQAFRVGASALLPDCRAYEMVSPLDKDNGDILPLGNADTIGDGAGDPAAFEQSSVSGGKLTYSSYRAFGGPEGAPFTSQYIATRDFTAGWSTEAISPSLGLPVPQADYNTRLETEFMAFSPDLCDAWLMHPYDPPLATDAPAAFANLYRRENCGDGSYETLTTVPPPGAGRIPELQGVSTDGSRAVFRTNDKLLPEATAAPYPFAQLYESVDGQLHFVCVLPDGTPSAQSCSAGTANSPTKPIRTQSVDHALSGDGLRIYWTASSTNSGPGTLYLRENPEQPQSAISAGKCTEAGKACTIAVSGTVPTTDPAQFWGAAVDGSKAIFSITAGPLAGNLYSFRLSTQKSTRIAKEVKGVLGVSENGSRVYFVSAEAITEEEENSEGGKAEEDRPNLYLFDDTKAGADRFRFIGVLSDADTIDNNTARTPLNARPYRHTATVSPDGRQVAFMSSGAPTDYDNTDVDSPAPCGTSEGICDAEVFLYDATGREGEGELDCISCNSTGARPAGRNVKREANVVGAFWVAAQIPVWETQLYQPRALSEDGHRLFFESFEELVPGDSNGGAKDVYEWEEAGTGGCSEDKAAFVQGAGGCISLISSGTSEQDSQFLDASPTGDDVFFTTYESLLSQDPGLVDAYDARVGGGFPPPPEKKQACEGDSCQSAGPPPSDDPPPASSTFRGAGNPPPPRKPRCPKGRRAVRRQGRTHCVKKGHKGKSGKHSKRNQAGARR